MTGPTTRLARPDEDDVVRGVLAAAFPDNPKARADVLRWQYRQCPYGEARTWVVEDEGEVIAVYTGVPVAVVVEGRPATAALGIDAAVLPAHQGRRLFTPLSRALYDDLGAQGWVYVLAYPSLASRRGIARAGWVEVARLRINVLPVDDAWVQERFRVPALASAALRGTAFRTARRGGSEVDGPPAGLDALWERTRPANGLVRDEAWFRWRYAAAPDPSAYRWFEVREQGRLAAVAVTTQKQAFGGTFTYVLEHTADSVRSARALTAALARGAQGTAGLAMLARGGSRADRLARAGGFRRLPRRLEPHPQWFGAVPTTPSSPDPAGLAWTVAWGDLDHL